MREGYLKRGTNVGAHMPIDENAPLAEFERPRPVVGSFRFLSAGAAIGAAWLASAHASAFLGWPLGAFVATAAYLAVVGAENAAVEVAS